jgi:dihydroneopterin aldolase
MTPLHQIEIRRMKVIASIGVPDEERAVPQELRVSLRIGIDTGFAAMDDDIGRTLDYAALAGDIHALAADRPRRLIETLAADIATRVLDHPRATEVEVVVEKFILPDTDAVAVVLRRGKSPL